jgi:hypothetical protein
MQSTTRSQRVWVSILPKRDPNQPIRPAHTVEPEWVVPGIVLDPTPLTRAIPGRVNPVTNAVDVLSFHRLEDGREFYRHQAQGLVGLNPRNMYAPDIDGPEDVPLTIGWHRTLLSYVADNQQNIVNQPNEDVMARAEAMFGAKQPQKETAATA